MPVLPPSCPLRILELHKNRVATIPDDYFKSTPKLERFSIFGNQITAIPDSLCTSCPALLGLQAQENKLTTLPTVAWPMDMEAVFLEGNEGLASLPASLKALPKLKRLNLGNLKLDEASSSLAAELCVNVMKHKGGIFWGADGKKKDSAVA